MPAITIHHKEELNPIEVVQVTDYMDRRYPDVNYTITQGNRCVWVYFSHFNLYFIFRDGQIADVQVD